MIEKLRFFRAWLSNPLKVGAVAPSSASLASVITSEILADSGPVLELGPGTGVFTRALLARGVRETDLTLIEHSADFVRLLNHQFPAASVRQMDASSLIQTDDLLKSNPAVAVVSGLPLLSMPPGKVIETLSGVLSHLRADGAFYQFTYGFRCPVSRRVLDQLDLKATRIGGTLLNIPPASVYRISRRQPLGYPALQNAIEPDAA